MSAVVPGGLIMLTGPSAAGKTTVALELQRLLEGRWAFWEVDRAQPHAAPQPGATVEDDLAMSRANLRALRAYLETGLSVIGEMDVLGRRQPLLDEVLGEFQPFLVVLYARREVLLERGRSRGTVLLDFVEWHGSRPVWETADCHLRLSTDDRSAKDTAEAIRAAYATR